MIKPAMGRMNTRIVLEKQVKATGAGGRTDVSYTDISTVWASVESRANSVKDVASRPEFSTAVTFTTHYQKAFLKTRRITIRGGGFLDRHFEVLSVHEPHMAAQAIIFETREIQDPDT